MTQLSCDLEVKRHSMFALLMLLPLDTHLHVSQSNRPLWLLVHLYLSIFSAARLHSFTRMTVLKQKAVFYIYQYSLTRSLHVIQFQVSLLISTTSFRCNATEESTILQCTYHFQLPTNFATKSDFVVDLLMVITTLDLLLSTKQDVTDWTTVCESRMTVWNISLTGQMSVLYLSSYDR